MKVLANQANARRVHFSREHRPGSKRTELVMMSLSPIQADRVGGGPGEGRGRRRPEVVDSSECGWRVGEGHLRLLLLRLEKLVGVKIDLCRLAGVIEWYKAERGKMLNSITFDSLEGFSEAIAARKTSSIPLAGLPKEPASRKVSNFPGIL